MNEQTILKQEAIVAATRYTKERDYWAKKLAGDIVKSTFPYDHDSHVVSESNQKTGIFNLQDETVSELLRIAGNANPRLHMILTAVLAILLGRYSGNTDIIIGTPIYDQGTEGEFINTVLTLRIMLENEQTFKEFLLSVRQTIIEAIENQNYPIDVLPFQAEVSFSNDDLPLFNTVILFENIHNKQYLSDIIPDIGFIFKRQENRLQMELEYNPKLYQEETILRIGKNYLYTVNAILANLDVQIGTLEIISAEEKAQLLYEFNNTAANYPKELTIHQLFEKQVEKAPDIIALVGANRHPRVSLSYQELNNQANGLAQSLIERGIIPGDIVAIKLERSSEMIIGILGILKSGGAYMPIDPEYPQERIDYMLKDSNAKILITNNEKIKTDNCQLSKVESRTSFQHSAFSILHSNFSNLAYIIYTSGSTGKPKGVMIEHQSIINTLYWRKNYYQFDEKDVILQLPSFSFDSSVEDIFTPLLSGSQLALIQSQQRFDVNYLKILLLNLNVTHFLILPNLYRTYIDEIPESLRCLRIVTVAGENFTENLVKKHFELLSGVRLINEYGPTENSVCTTVYEFTPTKPGILIGKPINNVNCYIVNPNWKLTPIGIAGELCVSGQGMGRGYLNRPELTAERFNFKMSYWSYRTSIFYKTGDLARFLSDGNIEFLGRIDQQVKVRGFRIELGEIESRLSKHPGIKEAVVLPQEDHSGDKYLCAYVVPNYEFVMQEIRDYLSIELPDYMIPSYFVQLEKIPLTPNGKIDRKALTKTNLKVNENNVKPRNEIEKKLAELWSEVLGRDALHVTQLRTSIGIDDNFFQIGGHSLKAAAVLARIEKRLNAKIFLEDIFKYSTIRELAEFIKQTEESIFCPINQVENKEYYALSSAQKRIYVLQQMDKEGTAYHITSAWILQGIIDKNKIEKSIRKLIRRHESLRTSFVLVHEEPVQRIHENVDFKNISSTDYTDYTDNIDDKVQHFISSFIRPFDLSQAPLIRVGLIKIEEKKHFLILDLHHIITDGLSLDILIRDFTGIYLENTLPEINLQYKDYAEWQNREKESKNFKKQESYWIKEFAGEIPVLELSTDYVRPAVQSFKGANINFETDIKTTEHLKLLALKTGATLYQALLAIYTVFLAKISGQEDIVVGIPVAGRRHADLEKIIGMFVNTLALRNYPTGEKKFNGFLLEVKENTLKGLDNQDYQYEELVEHVLVNKDISRNPLFDVMFVFQNIDIPVLEIPGLSLIPYEYENKTAKFDLTLSVLETDAKLLFAFAYCTKLFDAGTIHRFINYFKNTVAAVNADNDCRISDIEIISEAEKRLVLYNFNNTIVEYPEDKTIHQLFAEQAAKTPDCIALVGANRNTRVCPVQPVQPVSLSYQELNNQSNGLAQSLIEQGVICGDIVAIQLERSNEMIIGILGILKSGGAYLPIDPDYPQERINYMIKDSNAKMLLTTNDQEGEKVRRWEGKSLNSSNLAYTIYTSGSSGEPKGVMIEHRSVVNLVMGLKQVIYDLELPIHTALVSPFIFDASIKQIFPALLLGHVLFIIPENLRLEGDKLLAFFQRKSIQVSDGTPAHLKMLMNFKDRLAKDFSIEKFVIGGEILEKALCEEFIACVNKEKFKIINVYGPTECCDVTTSFTINGNNTKIFPRIPIGIPIKNSHVYIFGKAWNLQPIGIAGQLCIAGTGLARGYLNNPELTAERFNFNRSYWSYRASFFYKTGDLARWLPDGNIEFLGRMDNQVKIRGYRVELEEIENRLLKYHDIREAAVIFKDSLIAYIAADTEINIEEMRALLAGQLPAYMIPSYFMILKKIPLTANGKIDYKSLPEPIFKADYEYNGPRNNIEKKLIEIWAGVLGINRFHTPLGINDNFFHLGGHSLKVILAIAKINKAFNVNVPLVEFFQRPFIRDLATYIEAASEDKYICLEPVEEREYYNLSSAQERLFILHRLDENGIAYNITWAFTLEGEFDKNKLENTFKKIINRHESLRTSIFLVNEEPVQRIHKNVEFKIEQLKIRDEELGDSKVARMWSSFIQPFDLSQAPLLRVGLNKIKENSCILAIDMPHIVSDGISSGVFAREFMQLYEQKELPPLVIQYKDYASWQNNTKKTAEFKKQEEYWLNEFAGEIPVIDLPTDNPRPVVQCLEGDYYVFSIDRKETAAFKNLAFGVGMTPFMVLLAVFNIFLSKIVNQDEIVVGTPTAGRRHTDLENIIGVFINTLALKNYSLGDKTIAKFLNEIKERTLRAYENQDYPFEDLVDKLNAARDASRSPLFDVMMIFADLGIPSLKIPGLDLIPYNYEAKIAKFDLILQAAALEEQLNLSFVYSTALFHENTIRRFANYFSRVFTGILTEPNKKISALDILTDEEKKQLLSDFSGSYFPSGIDIFIFEYFERQVERTPDNIGVRSAYAVNGSRPNIQLTYRELNKKANQLAHQLRQNGLGPGEIAAIMAERSLATVIGILGILKSGAAYLPIDPDYPESRILVMLNDSSASLILASESYLKYFNFSYLKNLKSMHQDIIITLPRQSITNFDELPFPDRTLVDYEKYHQNIGNAPARYTVSLLSSRGCPYNCMFCHKIWPKQHVIRRAENIFQEIRYSYDSGIRRFVFLDDIFNFDLANSSKLLEMIIQHRMNIQLFFPNGLRSDRLTKKYIDLLAEAGAVNIDVALESASPRIQKLIRKNLNLEKFYENTTYILKTYPHIILELELMFGFPTETEEEALSTYELLKNLKWIHFPNLNILKIYPNTDISRIAIEKGIPEELINRSANLAYHEIPETLPFSREFALHYQARFFSEYFLSKERLLQVIPAQMKVLTEDEFVKKYNSYLPVEINSFNDLLQFAGISIQELGDAAFLQEEEMAAPDYGEKIKTYFPIKKPDDDAFRLLLLDCSQLFSTEAEGMLYDVIEAPLGLMSILTYLNRRFGTKISGKIAKSRIDYDSFAELKNLLDHFRPQLIGLRTLSFYKNFFHQTTTLIKQWYPDIPIITGGPYSTSDYSTILSDRNVDLAVLGEGEITMADLIEKIITNNGKLPGDNILKEIPGLAFIPGRDGANKKTGPRGVRNILFLDHFIAGNKDKNITNPVITNQPQDPAYILYTSGSTGKPKGVSMPHRAVSNLISWHLTDNGLSRPAVTMQFASFCFDVSFQEIFSTLCTGGQLIVLSKEMKQDIVSWFSLFTKYKLERVFLPFTVLQQFAALNEHMNEIPQSLKEIITAGERLQITLAIANLVKKFTNLTLYNHYGPTESHVVTTYVLKGPVNNWSQFPPIGRPVANTQLFILARSYHLVPPGVAGELCISGASVASGYLNRPELTTEKFKFNRSYWSYGTYIFYKTGDLARWLQNNNIDFLGRIDNQVKIRGFRVEPGEIENELLHYDKIREAAVTIEKDTNGDHYLCAYIVSEGKIEVSELRTYLAKSLPDYMIPPFIMQVTEIPLTTSGKVNRLALPGPGPGSPANYTAPRDELEKRLAAIWAEVLNRDKEDKFFIGIDDDFFTLGGHSLKATSLAAKLYQKLNIKLPLAEIFKTPTLRGLADQLRELPQIQYMALEPVEKKDYYILSSAQKRLYITQQMNLNDITYNTWVLMPLGQKASKTKLEDTFNRLIARHESLRTAFRMIGGQPVQRICEQVKFKIECCNLEGEDKKNIPDIIRSFIRPFDLSLAPLMRVGLIEIEKENQMLIVDIHHIITDDISHKILTRDFLALYEGKELPPLRIDYKDYAVWQNMEKQRDSIKKQEKYWLNEFSGELPQLNLPTDYPRPILPDLRGSFLFFKLDPHLSEKINILAGRLGVTVMMFLMAAYNILLSKYTGHEEIIVSTSTAGRRHADLENIIGFFINMLTFRTRPCQTKTFEIYLKEVKENAVNAYENQDFPFEELASKLAIKRQEGRHVLVETSFEFRVEEANATQIEEAWHYKNSELKVAHMDLILCGFSAADTIMMLFEYSTALFKRATIERFSNSYVEILTQIVAEPGIKLKDIQITINSLASASILMKDNIDDWDI